MVLSLLLVLCSPMAALSCLLGGGISIAGALLYALALRKIAETRFRPMAILYLHIIAEMAKLAGMLVSMLVVLVFFRQAEWIFVVGGCLAAYSAYWFGLLIKD